MRLRDAGCSSPTTSCGTPATRRWSSARGVLGLHRRSASYPTFSLATPPTPRFAKARMTRERPVPRLHGLGDTVVLGPAFARHPLGWTTGGHDAHRLLPATTIQCLRDLLDYKARRRG